MTLHGETVTVDRSVGGVGIVGFGILADDSRREVGTCGAMQCLMSVSQAPFCRVKSGCRGKNF